MDDRFRRSVMGGRPLVGTFIKTATHEIAEVLATTGIDFAIIDAEHAPVAIDQIDRTVLGARAAGLPCLVRLPSLAPALAGQMLDLGAAGVVVPHVADAAAAAAAAAEVRYAGGRRGFSPSTRAGGYGRTADLAARADAATTLWCQIEDAGALHRLDAIAATPGVDVLFVGRADLAQSMGVTADDPRLAHAVEDIARAGRRHAKALAIHVTAIAEADALAQLGYRLFVCGSDQSHLAAAAQALADAGERLRERSSSDRPQSR